MEEGLAHWANPSSPHAEGRKARRLLEDARERVKTALGWDGEVIFTSGASEAAALALNHAKAGARLVSTVEHDCILQAAPQPEQLPVLGNGAVDHENLAEAVQRERPLVAAQHVNSETGNRQDLAAIAAITCRRGRAAAGRLRAKRGAVRCARLRDGDRLGAQVRRADRRRRAAGEGLCHARTLGRAGTRLPARDREHARRARHGGSARSLRDGYLDPRARTARCAGRECRRIGGTWLSDRLADPTRYICAIAMPAMSATAQVMRFDMAGIAVSQGSLFQRHDEDQPRARGDALEPAIAANTIRVSFGWNTTRAEVERFCAVWLELAKDASPGRPSRRPGPAGPFANASEEHPIPHRFVRDDCGGHRNDLPRLPGHDPARARSARCHAALARRAGRDRFRQSAQPAPHGPAGQGRHRDGARTGRRAVPGGREGDFHLGATEAINLAIRGSERTDRSRSRRSNMPPCSTPRALPDPATCSTSRRTDNATRGRTCPPIRGWSA